MPNGRPTFRPQGKGNPAPHELRRPGIEERLRSQERVDYFADAERRAIKPELLDEKAEQVAKKMRDIPASQLRRFFGSVMDLKRRLEVDDKLRENPEPIRAELAFLKASAAYAAKRLNYEQNRNWQGDPLELVSFVTRHRNSVKDARDFEAFARHFEAVMAFHKIYGKER